MRLATLIFCILAVILPAGKAEPPAQPKDYTAHVVGYAHIDLAWLWRWEESVHDIMFNTFVNQLNMMEKYPDFTFAQDQAVVFEMMERYYPEIYKQILLRVKTHNWIPVSSTWVQMDENMPDGESLVRQFLYGQKLSKEKFGHYVRVAWQPDVFGHPYSMPQIARKAGIDFYIFGRPENPKRQPLFWWQGLDGSRVLGYNMAGWYTQPMDEHITEVTIKTGERAGVKNVLVLFGMGDHGGGPNPNDVAGIKRLNDSPSAVRVKTTNVDNYVDLLLAEKQDFQLWDGEHNPVVEGCYTSQVEVKRHNRRAEQLLLAAEKMSELAAFFRLRDYYPVRDLTEAWKLTLQNQFHDIMAGSGIGPIYPDTLKQYDEVFERGRRALNFSLQTIARRLDTTGEGIPLPVYNPHSWDRSDLVSAEIAAQSLPERLLARYGDEVVPVQVVAKQPNEPFRERATIAFVARNVPQMGLKLYRLVPAEGRSASADALRVGLKPRPFIENEFLRLEVNPATGNVARLYDKRNKREAFRGEANYLVGLEDRDISPKPEGVVTFAGSAWDLGLTGKKWDVDKADRVEVIEQGPARATLRVTRRYGESVFVQDLSLLAGSPRLDVEITVDWHERNALLKVGFPINATNEKTAIDIPYGVIERDQTGKEMDMGKWIDVSGKDFGVAILNNGRHGFDAKDNVLRISIIRGPSAPDPRADEGLHTFNYSIYPHAGSWREGKVPLQAQGFNSPLIALQEPKHPAPSTPLGGAENDYVELPPSYSFIKTGSDHVMLYAMKQMEGFYDRDAIVRFFEYEGREGDVTLELPYGVRAMETNLLEETIEPVGEGKTIRFRMKPWEIKTLRLARLN